MSLWEKTDARAWKSALESYRERLEAREVSRLPELDRWYQEELPQALARRQPPFVELDELAEVTSWKMKRGTYRARNLVLVRSNSPEDVRAQSREAFAALPDLRKPITALARLSGVGPATASAVLAAHRPDLFPFMDEEVAVQIPDLGKVAFTPGYYFRYAEALRERAQQLQAANPRTHWTAHQLAQALWAVAGG